MIAKSALFVAGLMVKYMFQNGQHFLVVENRIQLIQLSIFLILLLMFFFRLKAYLSLNICWRLWQSIRYWVPWAIRASYSTLITFYQTGALLDLKESFNEGMSISKAVAFAFLFATQKQSQLVYFSCWLKTWLNKLWLHLEYLERIRTDEFVLVLTAFFF